jgi:RimJ/RimL family protein N-acetyltransferase
LNIDFEPEAGTFDACRFFLMEFPSSPRLIFRLYERTDTDLFAGLFTDEEVMRFVDSGALSADGAELLWRRLTEEFYPAGKTTIYAVSAADDGRYVGHASIRPRPEFESDWEIGYILRRCEWGSGFGTEIAQALIGFGFVYLGLEEVFATVDDDHVASARVAVKAGMRFLRHEYDDRGRFSVFSIRSGQGPRNPDRTNRECI